MFNEKYNRAEVQLGVCVSLVCQLRHQVWFQQGMLEVAHLGSHQRIVCVCLIYIIEDGDTRRKVVKDELKTADENYSNELRSEDDSKSNNVDITDNKIISI